MNPFLSISTFVIVTSMVHLKSAKSSSWKNKLTLLDLPAFAIFLASIVCLLIALQWGGTKYSWRNARIIVLFIIFGLSLGIFAVLQIRKKDVALVPLRVITQRSIVFGMIFSFCTSGTGFILEYYASSNLYKAQIDVSGGLQAVIRQISITKLPNILNCTS